MTSRRAFTLIELLVTIAIIGILASFTMVAIGRVKHMSRSTACINNLRQIGIALQVYLEESNNCFPTLANRSSTNDPNPAIDTVLLRGSGGNVFRCPADIRRVFETTGTSYYWNFTINGQELNNIYSVVGGSDLTRVPILCDKEGFHAELRDKVNTLYGDCHAERQISFTVDLP